MLTSTAFWESTLQLTKHAVIRTYERTALHPSDILALLGFDGGVCLGSYDNFRYWCFYSLFDRDCKIAVVTADGEKLISIWQGDFMLPRGVRNPTDTDRTEAKVRFHSWLQKGARNAHTRVKAFDPNDMAQLGTVELEVRYDRRSVVHATRLVSLSDVRKKNVAKTTLRVELAASYAMIQSHFADRFGDVIEAIAICRFIVHGRSAPLVRFLPA